MSQQPLSPPQSNDGDFSSLQLLAQHNAVMDAHASPMYAVNASVPEAMVRYTIKAN